MCDVCRGAHSAHSVDITDAARGLLRLLSEWPTAERRATLVQLLGKWGKAAGRGVDGEAVVQAMVAQGLLRLDFGWTAYATNTYLACGPHASGVTEVRRPPHQVVPPPPPPPVLL